MWNNMISIKNQYHRITTIFGKCIDSHKKLFRKSVSK